jgi:hypothetical protein
MRKQKNNNNYNYETIREEEKAKRALEEAKGKAQMYRHIWSVA